MPKQVEQYVAKQLLITACICMGHVIIGYSMGWSSPVLEKLMNREQSPLTDGITAAEASWVASLSMVGGFIGFISIGVLANTIVRKSCIILMSLSTMLGYVLQAVALDITWIYCGQVIKGIGVSGTVVTNYMYMGEIMSPNIRGIMMAATGVFHCLGVLLVYAVGPFVSYRDVCYVVIAINILHLLSCGYFLPESPVFYVLKDKEDAANKVLRELGRSNDIETELRTMIETHKQHHTDAKIFQLFTIRTNRIVLIINLVMTVMNQGSGILCVLFYAERIFKSAASSVAPEIATIILGATQVAGSIVTPFFIDNYGRKTLMLLSTALCSIFLTMLGVYFYLELINYSSMTSIRWLPLFALMSYLFSFSFGINIIPSTLAGETFQPNMRSVGSSIAYTFGCCTAFASIAGFSHMVDAVGSHTTFWIYAAINMFGFFFTLFVVPETNGKSLMEIEAMFSNKRNIKQRLGRI